MRRTAAALALTLFWLAGNGRAEVYRCVDASGAVTFTDDASGCANARRHEIQSRLQRAPGSAPEAAAAPLPDEAEALEPPPGDRPDVQKAQWQQLKLRKEAELAALTQRIEKLERFVTSCNRGLEVVGRDATGIKTQVSCDHIRQEYEETKARRSELEDYLANGLARDCRRAGCLPGWIR